MPRPAVIFGGVSPEHDVSIFTGLMTARTLGDATCLYWSKAGDWYEVDGRLEGKDFADGVPRKSPQVQLVTGPGGGFLRKGKPVDVSAAVVCCHGAPGEDGTLQAALDLAGVRYTGPDVAAAALGMDKLAFGAVAAAAGLPVLPRVAVMAFDGWAPPFPGPYIVKPRFGGSSIGIVLAADAAAVVGAARQSVHLRAGAVVEPYRDGAADLEIAVRTYPATELSAISKPLSKGVYSYEQKYVGSEGMSSAPREMQPALPGSAEKVVREAAATVAAIARLRGVARVDFLLHGDEVVLNEVNTIPGSLAKHLWVDPPLPFASLLADMLEEAAQRPTTHWTTAGADGTALRAAGNIAGKLG